jgi:thiamine-monophosphate kinase
MSEHFSEFDVIHHFFTTKSADRQVRLGVGDDAALISPTPGMTLAASTDTMVVGRHFFADAPPETLGHKILAVNLSDMAAMGAVPRWALMSVALPDNNIFWIESFIKGFNALAKRFQVSLVGGDTVKGKLTLTLTIIGEVPENKAILRSGAKVGDDIWVSGEIGSAALALAAMKNRQHLNGKDFRELRARLETPEPRVALGFALRDIASAALDISDGLTGDLAHILEQSRVGAELELAAIPCHRALKQLAQSDDVHERRLGVDCLLSGGDDYELCFTAHPEHRDALDQLSRYLRLPLTRIGSIQPPESGLTVLDFHGKKIEKPPKAFDHFA